MERTKRLWRKKCRMANSIFSWLLVFAMVVSSVSTAPGLAITSLAAENEEGGAQISLTGENGDIGGSDAADDNGSSNDSGEAADDDAASEENGAGTDDGTVPPDGSDDNESGTDGNTSSAGDGNADDDADADGSGEEPEEDDGNLGDEEEEPAAVISEETENNAGNGARDGEVTVTLHVYNSQKWDLVKLHCWGSSGDYTTWPGQELTSEGNDWYQGKFNVQAGDAFNYLLNNGGNPTQTENAVIPASKLSSGGSYEFWAGIGVESSGKLLITTSSYKISGPEADGETVTFRYHNVSTSNVTVNGNWDEENSSWGGTAMTSGEDGVLTYPLSGLERGSLQYKFVVDGTWITDPFNSLYAGGNSLVYVPGEAKYQYTVHYYNPDAPNQSVETPDLHVWDNDATLPEGYGRAKDYNFENIETDDNGVSWLTTTFSDPSTSLGFIARPEAGIWDDSTKDADRFYELTGEKTEVELWYVHGDGIYDKKPTIRNVYKVEADLSLESMNYTQNNVLTLTVNEGKDIGPDENGDRLVKEAYVDASALGMSNKLMIDPELLEISLSVKETVKPGDYELPITVIGNNGTKAETTAEVTVTAKPDSETDFDWDEAVIYFMVTDRFFDGNDGNNAANGANTYGKNNPGLYHGGDFAGVTAKLDYLQELGVNTIWITPIVENVPGVDVTDNSVKDQVPFDSSYHGYWASDFTKLNPALGTDTDFRTLIDTAHAKGMKIMVDVVLNHAGYGAEDKFVGKLRDKNDVVQTSHILGGYQENLPDFLTENPEVRNQLIEWQVAWAAKGIDYFRVDTVQHVESTTWQAFKNALAKENPEFKMIGEYFGAGYNSNNGGTLGSGQMDSLLDFNFNEWATNFVNGNITSVENDLKQRNEALNNTYLTGQFLSSHDEKGFKYNLQQSGKTEEEAEAAAMVAATLQITAKGQPVIYYGEEIGQTGAYNWPFCDNRYDFDWTKTNDSTNKTLAHYKKMLNIRQQYSKIFAKGDRAVVGGSDADKYDVISRSYGGDTIYVGMNIDSVAKEVTIPVKSGVKSYTELYSGKVYQVEDGNVTVSIPAAADGGTIVLAAGGFEESLTPPELTIVKGKEFTLPATLIRVASDGKKEPVAVTYSMTAVAGVTLDEENGKITVAQAFTGKELTLTATAAGSLNVEFTVQVKEDKNEITLRLHYERSDKDYTGWKVWAWTDRLASKDYDFKDVDGEKVATIKMEGRANAYLNYIIHRSENGGEWEKDREEDQKIDLPDVISGTVDYYVKAGTDASQDRIVYGDDVLFGVKVISATYNKTNNTIKVVTGTPVEGDVNEAFTLKSGNEVISITRVTASGTTNYTLTLGKDLASIEAMAKKYILVFDGYDYPVEMPSVYSSEEFEGKYTYNGNDLGATWTKEKTTFKVWSPTANEMKVNLYQSGTKDTNDLIKSIPMKLGENGVWSAEEMGDLNGTYYTYTATQGGEVTEACDPYARTTGVNGNRAMVIDLDSTDPAGWASDRGPNEGMSYNDSIIYELHVRDFSIDDSSGISTTNKGKFLGLTEKGTKNTKGQTTGLDYLVDLGVTHIHLLPSYDYGSVDETKLDTPQFNWGYDPVNYNVPEGSYSTDPYNGETRVKEMKEMIKTLHDNNINVIMDVVYNHVYDADEFCFNQLVPQYFSRTNADGSYSNGSGCGNDTASERAMVKKYIVDSVNYWADEYHIDGFRFDLVGLLDADTINEVVDTVHVNHPDAVFYGEGWSMDSAVSKPNVTMATQANSTATPNFAYFSDTIRDAIKGNNGIVTDPGFVSGKTGIEELIANCFRATTSWCKSPTQTINYASCHDNYTLWDKICGSRSDASQEDRIKMNNLAAAIYMTAEGIPLIHAGEELLRTKVDESGKVQHNSYNLSDFVNSIKWNDLDKEGYSNVRDYYKGLIEFRKNHAALRLTSAADVEANVKYKWITNEVVMFVIGGKDTIKDEVSDGIVVIFNATNSEKEVNLYNNYGIATGTWNVCINDQKAGIETLASVTDGKVKVAPISAMVLVKGETEDQDSVYDKNKVDPVQKKLKAMKALIADYEELTETDYTEESWQSFEEALAAAKITAEKSDVTAEEIDSAMKKLQDAHEGLTKRTESGVDTSELQGLVNEYENLTQGNYTDETWTAFQKALTDANNVLKNSDATQEDIDSAKAALKKAYDELKVPEGSIDTGKLEASIADCDKLVEEGQGNYTDESWEKFTSALEAAKETLKKEGATQDDIDKAKAALDTARDGLTERIEPVVDPSGLQNLVNEYENLTQGEYTDETWTAFKDALKKAQDVLADSTATQEDIDKAQAALKKAYDELKVPEGSIDTNKLKALIEDCRNMLAEEEKYTSESWKNFTDALEAAENVLKKENATQPEINQAWDTLDNARKGLVEVEEIPDDTPEGLWVKWADDSMFTKDGDEYHITYTGKAIKPVIYVYEGKTQLKEKTDYTVSYKNNTNAGTASVIVKGKGNYKDTYTRSFIIDKVNLETLQIADLYAVVKADNSKQVPLKPTVKYNGKALKNKTDYTVAYENPDTDGIFIEPGKMSATYKVIVTANPDSKNYTGKNENVHMTLVNKTDAVLMSKVTIQKIQPQEYKWDAEKQRGKVQEPEVIVTYGKGPDNKLICKDDSQPQETWDYEVFYDEVHTEAGETATITVKGHGKYVGEKTVSFKITGTALKANQVSLEDLQNPEHIYTGSAQEPKVNVTGIEDKGYAQYSVDYQKNTDVGTATVIVTGKNGYTGTVKKTFKITAYNIQTNTDALFTYGTGNEITDQIPYEKGGSKLTDQNVNARFNVKDGITGQTLQTQHLEQGKDYTLSYKKNTAVGEASVTIKGKGNYKGTISNIPFTIVKKNLGALEANAVAGDILKKNAKKYNTVIPVITDTNGKKLKNKTDFTVDKTAYVLYIDAEGKEIEITETPVAGSVIRVTAEGKGNYEGTVTAEFRVIDNNMSIASAKVKVDPQVYTGKEVKPGKDAITVEMKVNGRWERIADSSYEITGYTNNIKKGTAKVTIHGTGDYGGTKTVSFKITPKPMEGIIQRMVPGIMDMIRNKMM